MTFEKQTIVDRIEVMADHTVAVSYLVTVTEDGKPFAVQCKLQILICQANKFILVVLITQQVCKYLYNFLTRNIK